MKIISSSFTFLYRYVFCYVWFIVGGAASIIAIFNYRSLGGGVFLWAIFYIATCFVLYRTLFKLKIVNISNTHIYFSGITEDTAVRIDDIESISNLQLSTPELIWITIKTKNALRRKIIFAPTTRLFRFKKHPIVQELIELRENRRK